MSHFIMQVERSQRNSFTSPVTTPFKGRLATSGDVAGVNALLVPGLGDEVVDPGEEVGQGEALGKSLAGLAVGSGSLGARAGGARAGRAGAGAGAGGGGARDGSSRGGGGRGGLGVGAGVVGLVVVRRVVRRVVGGLDRRGGSGGLGGAA